MPDDLLPLGIRLPLPGSTTTRLNEGWSLCESEPGAVRGPDGASALPWRPIERPGPAAAALRARGEWSLDGPPRRFDASDWWYRLRFDAPQGGDRLVFDGLATSCEVWLNGTPLLHSESMFERHACAVGALLRAHDNELLIACRSLDALLRARRPRPRWRTPMVEQQQLRWVRTTLLGRTPGWSPPCAVAGPWRDVVLERGPMLEVQAFDARVDGGAGRVRVALAARDGGFDPLAPSAALVVAEVEGRSFRAPFERDGDGPWIAEVAVPEAKLWWPHTHGEPVLHDVSLDLGGASLPLGRAGFRTIELRQSGGDFSLRVNGEPVFCRGACWTPIDVVSLRAEPAQYAAALDQVRQAGMNMLRVPGTGVYEDAAFLDACDANGVLVWHDFMFASMDYPGEDAAWLARVRREVAQQLLAWQRHPSVAVVCGNSEVSQQAAMWGAARAQWAPALFHEQMPAWVAQALPGTAYWPSSAWGGAFPHQPDSGTTSYYGVGAYLRPLEDARASGVRFATECLAFANVPGAAALARMPGGHALRATHAAWKQRAPRDLGAGWDFEDVRDHYMATLFGVDPARERALDHARYLDLARMASAEAMRAAFTWWRREGSSCGGALVWLLRDLWAGAGWGVLDEQGEPKAAWRALARVLQPCTVVLADEGLSGLVAHVVNETARPFAARLEWALWRGEARLAAGAHDFRMPARRTLAVPLASLAEGWMDLNHAYRFGPPAGEMVAVTLHEVGDAHARGTAFHFPDRARFTAPEDIGLSASAVAERDGRYTVRVSTRRPAVGIAFDCPEFVADDEYFHLAPGDVKVVTFTPRHAGTGALALSVRALNGRATLAVSAPKDETGAPTG